MRGIVPTDLLGALLDRLSCGLSCCFVLEQGGGQSLFGRGVHEMVRAVDTGNGGGDLHYPVTVGSGFC